MQKVCEERMKQFGQAGQAPNVPHVTLDQMSRDYEAGKFGANAKPDNLATPHKGKGGGARLWRTNKLPYTCPCPCPCPIFRHGRSSARRRSVL